MCGVLLGVLLGVAPPARACVRERMKKPLARLFRRTLFCFWYPTFPTTSKNNNFELLARDLVVCGWVVGGERERDPSWARARWWLGAA